MKPRPERDSWARADTLKPSPRRGPQNWRGQASPFGAHTLRARSVASRRPAGSQRSRKQCSHRRALAKACVEPGPAGSRSPKGAPDTSPGGRPSKPAAPGAHPGTRRGQARTPGTLRASSLRVVGGWGEWAGLPGERLPPSLQTSRHPGPGLGRRLDNSSAPPRCLGSPPSRSHPSSHLCARGLRVVSPGLTCSELRGALRRAAPPGPRE